MHPSIDIKLLAWDAARNEAYRIRHAVFVVEQGVPAEVEIDSHDPPSEHALAFTPAGVAIATGRLLPDGHIGRMAVLREWRGGGVGAAVLQALIERAWLRGLGALRLSAQTHAEGFYARHGFVAQGPSYLDVGIAHVDMTLLRPSIETVRPSH